jgi:hypothetical protein
MTKPLLLKLGLLIFSLALILILMVYLFFPFIIRTLYPNRANYYISQYEMMKVDKKKAKQIAEDAPGFKEGIDYAEKEDILSVSKENTVYVCTSFKLWEGELSTGETVVAAPTSCAEYEKINGEATVYSSGLSTHLFKVEKKGDSYKILDYDRRMFARDIPAEWVTEAYEIMPLEVKYYDYNVILERNNKKVLEKIIGPDEV